MKPLVILHPYAQVLIFILSSLCIFLTTKILLLLGSYCFIFLLLSISNQVKWHFRFLLFAIFPFVFFLFLVYVVILKNQSINGHPSGVNYLSVLAIRIICFTSLWQWLFNIPVNYLMPVLKKLGLTGSLLIIVISSFSVLNDIRSRADRILTARLSRGFMKNRSVFSRLSQIPFLIKPLFISVIILALERSASWEQRELLKEIDTITNASFTEVKYARKLSILFIAIIFSWFIIINLKD